MKNDEINLGIVVSEYNYDITMMMLERAKAHAEFLGCQVKDVMRVPGVYDIPFALNRLLKKDKVHCAVTLGVVIEGDTQHDEVVMGQAARKIIDLALQYDKPVGLGVTGPGMSRLQAEARIENARSAVEAAVKLLKNC